MTDLLPVHVMFKLKYMYACDRYFLETSALNLIQRWNEWKIDKMYKFISNFCVCSDISEISFFGWYEHFICLCIIPKKKPKSMRAIIKKRGGGAQSIMYIQNKTIDFSAVFSSWTNLTKVRPLFTLSHRGSDNSRLLIVFSANNIDQSIGYFYATESRLNDFVILKNNALRLKYAIWLVEIMMQCDWK